MSKKANSELADALRYITAMLESDLYLGRKARQPREALLHLLAKFGVATAQPDPFMDLTSAGQYVAQASNMASALNSINVKKPCKRCPSNKCSNCPVK